MPKGDGILLRHMLDAALKVSHFIQGRSRRELDSDEMLALMVCVPLLFEFDLRLSPQAIQFFFNFLWEPIPNQSLIGY